ncbi:hypothetical protein D3C71_2180650 [compost metagenome]
MTIEAVTGFNSGSTIVRKVLTGPHPSISADSSSSFGMPLRKPVYRKIENGMVMAMYMNMMP